MIKKLEKHIIGENAPGTVSLMVAPTAEQQVDKINELVDKINALVESNNIHEKQIDELQMKVEPEKCEAPVDPYTEQQKWIGKLCKFWDYDGEEKWFSTLEHIDKNSPYPYCASGDWWYKHCEPVKPDSELIYHGE